MTMTKKRMEFCIECREEVPYQLRKIQSKYRIREKEYVFEITKAFCEKCGSEMLIPGMMDKRAREVDEQYRKAENIVSANDINKLLEIYKIGKSPLSLALGFGEITITRYLQGQIPSKEYSDVIKKALESPEYMIEQLKKNKEKIKETAYEKAIKAAEEVAGLFHISAKMLSTISYIFEKEQEVTPLALQKILYFIQGVYMVLFDKPLYEEDCQAWVHGPVYETVYEIFKTFKYNPIDDNRFVMFKNRFQELTEDEKMVIDLIVNTFGIYSGRVLEIITHYEEPWLQAREGYLPTEPSNVVISKESIKKYFKDVHKHYNLKNIDGIKQYINKRLENI